MTKSTDADRFAVELSELGRKFGIGIGGTPILFVLENEDLLFDYTVDDESNLCFGGAPTR